MRMLRNSSSSSAPLSLAAAPRSIGLGKDRAALLDGDVDRHAQPAVVHDREAVDAGELVRDGLHEGVLLELLEDRRARLQHQVEELVLVEFAVVDQHQVRQQVVVGLVKLVEVHGESIGRHR